MNLDLGSRFLQALGRLSVQAAVLVLLVLLAQLVFRRWLTPRWRCSLWLLVVGRLLLPVSLPTPVSVFNLVPARPSEKDTHGIVPVGPAQSEQVTTRQPEASPARVSRSIGEEQERVATPAIVVDSGARVTPATAPPPAPRQHKAISWPMFLLSV